MSQKIAFIRVGIDKVCGGISSPIFQDQSFEFIPIPEYYYKTHGITPKGGLKTFGNTEGRNGKAFIEYFKEGKDKEDHLNCPIHDDPEFITFSYGDPNATKNTLVNLEEDDYLVFYTFLQSEDESAQKTGFYVIGFLEVDYSCLASSEEDYDLIKEDFEENFHIKNKEIFLRDIKDPKNKGLKLVKGTVRSKLLKKAVLISQPTSEEAGRHEISITMQKIMGNFGGNVSIQKSPLRWVKDKDLVKSTLAWLKTLS